MSNSEIKECPYCAEEINANAIKCKHCKTMLNDATPRRSSTAQKQVNKINLLKWTVIPIVVVVVLIGAAFLIAYFDKDSEVANDNYTDVSNGVANHHRWGMATSGDGWVYYSLGDGESAFINRMQTNGETREPFYNISGMHLNIYEDYLYFLVPGDGIHKLSLDGTKLIRISDIKTSFVIEDGWLYYSNSSVVYPADEVGIYRLSINGGDPFKINDIDTNNINVVDGWIYYTDRNNSNIYKVRVDGRDITKLNDDTSYDVCVDDRWVYYITKGEIYKIRTDGSEKTQITEINGGLWGKKIDDLNVAGDWIYFTLRAEDRTDVAFYLHRIPCDGGTIQQISSDYTSLFSIAGGWIFYLNFDDDEWLYYMMRTDGSERQRLE